MTFRYSRSAAFDSAVVALAIALAEVEVFAADNVPGPHLGRALPLLLLLAVPLTVRRTFPLLACVLVYAGVGAFGAVWGSPEGLELIAPVAIVSYSVAANGSRRSALAGLAVIVAGYTTYALQDPNVMNGGSGDTWAAAFFGVAALALWLAGVFVQTRGESTRLAGRAAELERDAQVAVSDERARMARELHDIVSHNLSVVVLQAAGARASGAGAATLEKIERSGREALVEMRRLLGVLREDDNDAAELGPQPGIAQLEALATGVRAAGLPVELSADGDFAHLPPAVELSVYRIVQEALTNALKHAGPARAEVRIRRESGTLTVEVLDDGRGSGGSGGGHGLLGMRERVALFGGELRAGPRPEGGFAVHATLPVDG